MEDYGKRIGKKSSEGYAEATEYAPRDDMPREREDRPRDRDDRPKERDDRRRDDRPRDDRRRDNSRDRRPRDDRRRDDSRDRRRRDDSRDRRRRDDSRDRKSRKSRSRSREKNNNTEENNSDVLTWDPEASRARRGPSRFTDYMLDVSATNNNILYTPDGKIDLHSIRWNTYAAGNAIYNQLSINVPKESKELFVGNVPAGVSDAVLKEFLNGALRQIGLAKPHEDPISGIRLAPKYCFLEFRTPDDCSHGLNLNGIPFMGQELKISRPSKYIGQMTIARTWQEITGQVPLSEDIPDFTGADSTTKLQRELFVGNTNPETSNTELKKFLSDALRKMGLAATSLYGEGLTPVVQVRKVGQYSFVEFRTREEAANALNLSGITCNGNALKISRPTKFTGGANFNFLTYDDLLARWMTGELKVMTAGPLSRVVRLSNMITSAELSDSSLYAEVIDETREECSRFGKVINCIAPTAPESAVGKMFIEMSNEDEAKALLCALKGRTFDSRIVDAKFYPMEFFNHKNYAVDIPHFVVTQSGPFLVDHILQSTNNPLATYLSNSNN